MDHVSACLRESLMEKKRNAYSGGILRSQVRIDFTGHLSWNQQMLCVGLTKWVLLTIQELAHYRNRLLHAIIFADCKS